jgi:predicted nucleic acid-binding protein
VADPFFDTNIVIDWLNRQPKAKAELLRYKRHRISRIVWTEVLACEAFEDREAVRQVISAFDIVELDARAALAAADIRHRTGMKLIDAYILATAQVNGAILITRNTKDFPAEMPGIRIPYTLQQEGD